MFHQRGVSRTSLQEIAKDAGLTRGAIYWHFENKGELFHAMMERVTLPMMARMTEITPDDEERPLEKIRRNTASALQQIAHDAQVRRVFEIATQKVEYVDELQSMRERHIAGRNECMDDMHRLMQLARDKGLGVHLDGARLFNAAVATKAAGESGLASARRITSLFDSVSVCFSKGLGAPVGSALCGSYELIAKALRWRKVLGGGLRQSGVLAAAALHALDHHVDRLADDHALAQRLAQGLQGMPGLSVRSAQTNIVFVDVADGRGLALLEALKAQGVLATGLIGLRFVTHLGVDAAGIDHALACIRRFMQTPAGDVAQGLARSAVY